MRHMKRFGVTLIVALAALAPSSSAATSPTLVTFEQTGGFAGIERGFSVQKTGKVVSDGLPVTAKQLSTKRMVALRLALVNARWGTLAHRYESTSGMADGYIYKLSYGGKTIKIEEDAKLPARLARPFALLRTLGGIQE